MRDLFSLFLLLFLFMAVAYLFVDYDYLKSQYILFVYDMETKQERIAANAEVDRVLNELDRRPFKSLEKDYLTKTKSTHKKYKKMLQDKHYYLVEGDDILKYVVGGFRIRDFMPKDHYFKQNLKNLQKGEIQYWLMNPKALHKLCELQLELERMGMDPNGFEVISAFRHPKYNEEIKGAGKSSHIRGEAIDLTIKDINKDGYANMLDKEIVLEILDEKVIGSEGGIGRYPNSMSVHFDVRGYRARWDSY